MSLLMTLAIKKDVEVPGFTFEQKKWYHYAMTYNGKVVKIYVDGKVVNETSKSVKLPEFETPVLLGTGEAPGTHPTQGIIDEVWVFNRALSDGEIKTIMEEGPATALLRNRCRKLRLENKIVLYKKW